ncbi:MAG: TetR/AcrR family transcriptional regulator [Actinomycetota bacterium]|nr:TetR/AcrR family transcriptional regulator [Actinomycetota bacterium]
MSRSPVGPQVLPTALELFSRQGFHGTSMQEVAERLEITKPALYHHVRSKEEVLTRLAQPFLDDVDRLLAQPPEGRPRILSAYLEILARHRSMIRVIGGDPSVRNHPAIRDRFACQIDVMYDLLAGSEPTPGDRVRAAAAVGALWQPLAELPELELKPHWADLVGAALAALESSPTDLA